MPAQRREAQIDIPVFRMLGSDPIYQYDLGIGGTAQGEPVYPKSGGSEQWVRWFLDMLTNGHGLAFTYAQTGQENSFGWPLIEPGLEMQVALISELSRSGRLEVQTLEQTGTWFREKYQMTPATSVVALNDWKDEGRSSIWYNSRYYRINLLIENGVIFIRDIHLFDESISSEAHYKPLRGNHLICETLPILDGFQWGRSTSQEDRATMQFFSLLQEGLPATALALSGSVSVTEEGATSDGPFPDQKWRQHSSGLSRKRNIHIGSEYY